MQIYAEGADGILISSYEAQKQGDYRCLECRKILKLRGGNQRRLHFYHLEASPSCRQNGKSETHLALQMHIQRLFGIEECTLEKRFTEIERIADCFCSSKKLVIEIQCSPISTEEVQARTRDYNSLNFNVLWILHENVFNRRKLTGVEAFLRCKPHFFTNFDEEGRGMIYSQSWKERGGYRSFWGSKISVDLREERLFVKLSLFRRWQWWAMKCLRRCP